MSLLDRIIQVESGGNNNAKNPNSSATGPSQFIQATWLDMLSRHRPDLVQGKSKEEVLALRSDPALSREMTGAYAAENGAMLSKAGLPVTPGTTYLAHFAGPKGAVGVLQADPSAPVGAVLGEAAVRANPFLKGMTVADLRAWADRKMGAQPSQPSQPVQPAQSVPAQPAPSIFSPAPQAAPQQPAPMQVEQPVSLFGGMPPPGRRPIDLSKLRAALQASGNRGLFNRG